MRELVPQLRYLDNLRVEENERCCSSSVGEDWVILQNAIKDSKSHMAAAEGLCFKCVLESSCAHRVTTGYSFLSLQKKPQGWPVPAAERCLLVIVSALPLFGPTIQLTDPPQALDPRQPSGLDLYPLLDQDLVLQVFISTLLQPIHTFL